MNFFICSCFILMNCVTGAADILDTVSFVQSSNGQTKDLYWEMDCVDEHSVSATVDSQQEYITFNTNQYPVTAFRSFVLFLSLPFNNEFQLFVAFFFFFNFSVLEKKKFFFSWVRLVACRFSMSKWKRVLHCWS